MKKIIGGLVVLVTCICFNTTITKAETFNASSLVEKQLYHEGDIIHNDTSSIFEITKARKGGGAIEPIRLNPNEDYTLDLDVYCSHYDTVNNYVELCTFWVERKTKIITVNEGDNVAFSLSEICDLHSASSYLTFFYEVTSKEQYDYVNSHGGGYQYIIRTVDSEFTINDIDCSKLTCDSRLYGKDTYILNYWIDGESVTSLAGSYIINITHDNDHYPHKVKHEKEEVEEEPKEVYNEPTKTPEQIESERKNKDTLPTGTIQGIGGKKDFNFKALNPVQRDVNNQQIFADYYAKQLGFKSELLISKDIYAPYGQTKESKWQSRTISWKNTGAKFGDLIYVVWYCQEAHEMQFIQANVLPDGTVVFTIPKSGDVSTISIVKLNK